MAIPKALLNLAKRHWDKVLRAADLPAAPFASAQMLGCGSWGCVYQSPDPRWVVKFTRDPTEGSVLSTVMDVQPMEGLALVRGAWSLAEGLSYRGKEHAVYAAVREAVMPLDASGFYRPAAWGQRDPNSYEVKLERGLRLLRGGGFGAGRAGPPPGYLDLMRKFKATKRAATARRIWEDALEVVYEMQNTDVVYNIGFALERLADAGSPLVDVHTGNVGYRMFDWPDEGLEKGWPPRGEGEYAHPGPLLIFDFGHIREAVRSPLRLPNRPRR